MSAEEIAALEERLAALRAAEAARQEEAVPQQDEPVDAGLAAEQQLRALGPGVGVGAEPDLVAPGALEVAADPEPEPADPYYRSRSLDPDDFGELTRTGGHDAGGHAGLGAAMSN